MNGLRSKWQEVSNFVEEHDIVVITETKLDSVVSANSLTLKGFTANRLDRNSNGGGVLSYVRSSLNPTVLHDLQERAVVLGLECTLSKIQVQGVKKPVIVMGAYRPPNAIQGWFDNMSSLVNEILPLGPIVIMGDLNADLLQPKLAPCKSLRALLALANVKVSMVSPTRITAETATCLDLIAIDKSILCIHYEVGTLSISGHLPVLASINFKGRHILEPVMKRSLRKVDFDTVRNTVAMIQLKDLTTCSIDEILSDWYCSITKIIDSVAPLKSYPWRKSRSPWITEDIRQLMDRRESLVREVKRSNEKHSCDELKVVKKQIKSRIRRETRNAGLQALQDRDTKKAWQFIKSATFTQDKNSETLQDLHVFNAFFADTVTAKNLSNPSTIHTPVSAPTFSFHSVLPEDVYNELKLTDRAAAPGPDSLSGHLIKALAPAICANVSIICNLSISQGYFPSLWKEANITPIWKGKGAKEDPNNYRPISILPIVARMFERLIASQLYRHCDCNNIIPDQQFGFRKRSSCETALLKATDLWLSQVDAGLFVGALLIDLSKAFDSVPHIMLMEELSAVGCDDIVLRWFASFLANRLQRVTPGSTATPGCQSLRGFRRAVVLVFYFLTSLSEISLLPARLQSSSLQTTRRPLRPIKT